MPQEINEGPTHLELMTSDLNLATTNKWLATIPINKIFPNIDMKRVALNLVSYNLPDFSVGAADVSFQGVTIQVPNYVRSQSKEITFEYHLTSDWHQWKLLYKWMNIIVQQIGAGSNFTGDGGDYRLPIHVYLISEFKNPAFEITYNDCWIKNFGAVSLDYTDPEDKHIRHSFTVAYTYFELNDKF